MNREDMLREMGITPLWKARGAAPQADAVAATESAPVRQEMAAAEDEPPAYLSEAPAEFQTRPAQRSPVAKPQHEAAPAPAGVDPARIEHIARMEWPALKEAVAGCQACTLCTGRKNTVFGVGDERADWMIIGEAPGAEEDARGEPFVGQAGRLLDSMLAALDMKREANVYIANVLKCRPPGNRNPEPLEVAQCSPHLLRQVALIKPRLIILMGRFAAQTLLNTDASIASMRGRLHRYQGTPAIVTYHPAYLLRNLPDKSKAWADLLFARRTYRGLQDEAAQ
ncbi:MAG TPA: uracil-DNA glycosylase [Burkholderiales bacterium]|jgi:DNA polymerase